MIRLVVLAIAGVLTLASEASACSCGSPRSAADAAAGHSSSSPAA